MSNFREFDPDKPETWPLTFDGEALELGGCSTWVIGRIRTDAGGATYDAMRLEYGSAGAWWTDGRFTLKASSVVSWHPLPTPDDGMVMVPEKLSDHAVENFARYVGVPEWQFLRLWAFCLKCLAELGGRGGMEATQ